MKTLAEQSMKQQQVDSVPIQVEPAAEIKLIDTTNIQQQNGANNNNRMQRKSITRQSQVDDQQANFVAALKANQIQWPTNNGHQLSGSENKPTETAKTTTITTTANNSENLTTSIVNKLNGHLQTNESKPRKSPPTARKQPATPSKQAGKKRAAAQVKEAPEASQQQKAKESEEAAAAAPSKAANSNSNNNQEIGFVKKLTIDCLLYLIKGLIATYDLISQPIFYFKHDVAKRRHDVEALKSCKLNPSDPHSPWRQIDITPWQLEVERQINAYPTYDQMLKASFRANGPHQCYGYRQVLEERMTKRPDNPDKLIRQVALSDYKWINYNQFEVQIEAVRRGLLREGVRANQRVILFADTRPEWQICSQAIIRLGAVVGTMYSTLGIEGIVHTVNETQTELIIAQRDKVERLIKLAHKLPKLKKVIYFENCLHLPAELGGEPADERAHLECASDANQMVSSGDGIERKSFNRVLQNGLDLAKPELSEELARLEHDNNGDGKLSRRTKDTLAVIMYTSGSTGIPKGVLISHGNIQATLKSFSYVTKDFICKPREHTCVAYLPLAHIFEFCIESVMLFHGVRFGFASPHTLTEKSPGIMPGQTGDLALLRPTVMIIVPLILDRIVQGIKQVLKSQGYFKEQLVSYLIDYKTYWQKRHYETPLVDKLICRKMAVAMGGNLKYGICGSAPLSGQTQTFIRAALNLKLPQGFGTTETVGATSCQLFDDQSTQNVGLPLSGAHVKLEAWPEGNYHPTDKPNPRGEICVGGEMIAHGYFNLDEQTKEAFYVDEEGRRWYRTGDIGEFLPNGQLKIIDRKKDLVKLQNGEYISLGRVESTLKSNPYTDNFCVYANSNYNYVIALGPANEAAIRTLGQQIVDEAERKLTPNTTKRLNGSQTSLASASADPSASEPLLMSDDAKQAAIAELKEVLSSYESDRLNNNNTAAAATAATNSKPSSPSQQRPRANSADPPPLASCLDERLNKLCENPLIKQRVHSFICKMARERNLLTLELPKKILLLAEEWTEDKNLVTAAMKIRRNYIYKRYERELDRLYESDAVQ